ncbi:MAG: phosphatidylserine decarboxylase, partial [Lachnospiraceae bacterium]|nr:phosphatidylserine decarboxylase [Lachnospiraceae bacterium]
MDYRDREGNLVKNKTGQDKFLHFVYSNIPGRAVMKLLALPFVSRVVGRFMDAWPSTFLIGSFIRKNHIRLSDYEKKRYRSFNEFFTRKIRAEKRPIDREPSHLIAPCDSLVTVYPIDLRTKIRIKHSCYTVSSLLQDDLLAAEFVGGYCVVLRMTVEKYHRYCYVDD